MRLTLLALATSALVITATARAQQPGPAPEQPPAPAPERTPAPAPGPLTPEERIRALEERLAALEGARPEAPALEERVGTLEATLRNVVLAVADQVKVTGLVSASYTWNLADPPGRRGTNALRVSDPDHDTFAVTYAKLGLYRDLSGGNEWDAGFRAELAAGRLVEQTLSLDPDFNGGDEVNLANAYVQLQAPTPLGRPLTITAGRFYGWFGVESLDVPTNPNFSLSYFSNFTPFTNTGVGVGLELVDNLKYTQYVVNGWDLVFDDNDSKSYGGQLAYTLDDPATTIALDWLVGAEQPDDEEDLRWLVELDLTTRLTETTELRAALHYGQEEGAAQPGRAGGPIRGVAKYGGAMLIVRQELHEVRDGFRRFAIGARTGFWRDQGGSKSTLSQTLTDLTGTFEVRFTEWASLRFEWRHDHSNRAFFLGGAASRRSTTRTPPRSSSMSASDERGAPCPVCLVVPTARAVACRWCLAPHHLTCWGDGCAACGDAEAPTSLTELRTTAARAAGPMGRGRAAAALLVALAIPYAAWYVRAEADLAADLAVRGVRGEAEVLERRAGRVRDEVRWAWRVDGVLHERTGCARDERPGERLVVTWLPEAPADAVRSGERLAPTWPPLAPLVALVLTAGLLVAFPSTTPRWS